MPAEGVLDKSARCMVGMIAKEHRRRWKCPSGADFCHVSWPRTGVCFGLGYEVQACALKQKSPAERPHWPVGFTGRQVRRSRRAAQVEGRGRPGVRRRAFPFTSGGDRLSLDQVGIKNAAARVHRWTERGWHRITLLGRADEMVEW